MMVFAYELIEILNVMFSWTRDHRNWLEAGWLGTRRNWSN